MISLTKQFVKEMERRILTGEMEISSKIPPLRVLAQEFHVSRSVINAGIVELCNNGYLVTVPRKYICVSDWRKTGNFAMLNGLIENGLCDEDFFDDLFAGRMTIEKAIIRAAAKARTDQDLEEIKRIIDREEVCCNEKVLDRSKQIKERAEVDKDFHHALAVASHNTVYTVILNSFHSLEDKLMLEFYAKEIDYAFVVEMHKSLYEALKTRDADEAERTMESLLAHGESELQKASKQ